MKFDEAEKLAIIKLIDAVIHADGVVHEGEINALTKLMKVLDFDSSAILFARNVTTDQGIDVLKEMSIDKKENLASILEEIAISDGHVHEKERALLQASFEAIGVLQPKRKSGN